VEVIVIEEAAPAAQPPAAAAPAAQPPAAVAPAAQPPAADPPAKPADADSTAVESDAALLTVSVPLDASVVVNGYKTQAVGLVRQFKSRGLKPGFVYTYVVDVTYTVDGSELTESKSVKLRPGTSELIEFAASTTVAVETENQDLTTVVQLHVPADAKITLAGNVTDGDGELRTYRTHQLTAGEVWSGYTVRVTTEINGKAVSKERTLDLVAGSTNDLTFEFGVNELASR
jgi:uncharacterized protein (TIGR03000 family)